MKRRLPKNGTIGITVFGVLVCLWIVGIWTTLPVMGTLHENVKVKIFWTVISAFLLVVVCDAYRRQWRGK